jgi:hypothetical protein
MNFVATVVERVLTEITWVAMHVVIVSEPWQRRLPRHIAAGAARSAASGASGCAVTAADR